MFMIAMSGAPLQFAERKASQDRHQQAALQPHARNSSSSCGPQPSVSVAGDHAMSLSDGQSFESLNTGIVLYPCVASIWEPAQHQHNIRAQDLDTITAASSVKNVVVGGPPPATRAHARARRERVRGL